MYISIRGRGPHSIPIQASRMSNAVHGRAASGSARYGIPSAQTQKRGYHKIIKSDNKVTPF